MPVLDKRLRRDLGMLGLTTGLGTIAAVTPARARRRVVSGIVATQDRLRRERPFRRAEVRDSEELREAVLDHRKAARGLRIEQGFCQGYGIYRRGWPAQIRVTGLDHLRAAHAEGRGVILWQMSFLDLTPVFLALADAGFPVSHLSSEYHRIDSRQELSRRVIGPVLIRGECRALHERLVIPRSGNLGYLKRLRSIVEDEHGTVSIRGDFTQGRREIEAPHLGHVVAFPTGAPSLAHRTGAPLLTSAALRTGLLEHEVVIDEPISASRQLPRRDFERAAIEEFARRLEERARDHPDSRSLLAFFGRP